MYDFGFGLPGLFAALVVYNAFKAAYFIIFLYRICLLYGYLNEQPMFMMVWLVVYMIGIVLHFVGVITCIILAIVD